ncbi:MAG: hypothetical protein JNK46_19860 [Methylobacteriaceae bacterium]|nr:hypothetical protein [Methylobacteriaceae bacterium]
MIVSPAKKAQTWRLSLLGRSRLLDPAGEPVHVPKKLFALALYLLTDARNRSVDRQQIGELLWGEAPPETQQANTRSFLRRVRAAQTTAWPFLVTRCGITLRQIECDYEQLLHSLLHGSARHAAAAIVGAKSSLIAGSDKGSPQFELWVQNKSGWLESMMLDRASLILEQQALDGDLALETALAHFVLARDRSHQAARRIVTRETLSIRPNKVIRSKGSIQVVVRSARLSMQGRTIERKATPNHQPTLIVTSIDDHGSATTSKQSDDLFESILSELWLVKSIKIVVGEGGAPNNHDDGDVNSYRLLTRIAFLATQRLRLRLIHVATNEMIWAESFHFRGELTDSLARKIAAQVASKIEANEVSLNADRPETDQSNFALVAQAEVSMRTNTLQSIRRARRLLRLALQRDANFSVAQAGVARTLRLEWILCGAADLTLLERALHCVTLALHQAPESAIAHRDAGMVALYQRRFELATKHLELARNFNHSDADLLLDYCDALISLGESEKAVQILAKDDILRSRHLDMRRWIAATGQYALGRYEDAIAEIDAMRTREPAFRLYAACHAMIGNTDVAGEYVRKSLEENPTFRMDRWLSSTPFKRNEDVAHFIEGVAKAGFSLV